MKSFANIGESPAALPLIADELVELHAARLLLLFHVCGTKNRIEGLTKMAKLDFFVRYPQFFDEICKHLGQDRPMRPVSFESGMVRFHYGPWDRRYYHVLAFLEGRDLVKVTKEGKAFQFTLTDQGKELARRLRGKESFNTLVRQMKGVKNVLGRKTGSALKKLIYEVFDKEIATKPLGERIG